MEVLWAEWWEFHRVSVKTESSVLESLRLYEVSGVSDWAPVFQSD